MAPGLLQLRRGVLETLLGLLPGLLGRRELLRDGPLPSLRGRNHPRVHPAREHQDHHDERDDLGEEGEAQVEQARLEVRGQVHGHLNPT